MGWGRAAACPFVLPFAPLVPFSLDLLFSRRRRHRPRAAAAALPHLLPFLSHGLLSLAAPHLLVRVGLSLASTVVDLASPAASGSATKGMDPAAVLGGLVPSWSAAVVLVSYLAAAGAVFPGKLVAGLPESSRFAHPRPRLRLLLRRRDHLHRGERPHAAHQPCASPPSFPRRHRPARVCLVILLLLIKASRASRAGQIQPWWPRSSSLTSCSALPEPADDLRGHPSPRWWAKEVRVSGEFVVPISDSVLDDGEVATVEPRSKFGTCPSVRDAVLSSTAVILTSPSILLGIDSIGEPSSRLLAQCLH